MPTRTLITSPQTPAPPDIEPTPAERHAPVSFTARGLGSIVAALGAWPVGDLRAEANGQAWQYIVRLPGLREAWRRPVPLEDAKDRVAELVRQWLEAAGLTRWAIERQARAAAHLAGPR